ncbi:Imm21 family immunity protein [Streptomyces sp. TRM 70361]|uniref:Imm21 family immunity protein n=1 Tax=Streptomyces sp. TRM 70361 TaxID=3116553 RepID=UPI002E7BCC3A|nr:Imm21 family immunity protein [Streptomyces sp. TRM 70361]MEE1943116.1 Imm21 family immunity protein [Streptomyces sp. TRM 70361]
MTSKCELARRGPELPLTGPSGQATHEGDHPTETPARRTLPGPVWVASMGGPLIVVPLSALQQWGGCTEAGMILGGDTPDDHDRACAVDNLAAVIDIGPSGARALGVIVKNCGSAGLFGPRWPRGVR